MDTVSQTRETATEDRRNALALIMRGVAASRDAGRSHTYISVQFGIPESAVRAILKRHDELTKA